MDTDLLYRRARLHAALGDPSRLAIVDALLLGDASPGQIAQDLGLPTNLVAHHIRVLEEAGLLTRRRSEGDRRRSYLSLRPETLDLTRPPSPRGARRVLFVCTHNSARSQLAAALWGRRARIPAISAGTRPAPRVHPRALAVARRYGLRLAATATAHIDAVAADGDLVVAVCDRAYEELTPGRARLHWSVPDPAAVDTDAAFEAAFADIAARVDRLLPMVDTAPEDAGPSR
jgi:protein-tyrosine-phosphatase/DNA-binding MarR family transcriptional regulator